MTDDWTHLERGVEAGIDALSSRLDLRAPFEVAERAHLAARVALDERLLENSEVFIPQALRNRLRETVRYAMGSPSRSDRWHAWWLRHARGLSALASAAMIGICIGVIHHAAGLSHHINTDPFERFVNADKEVYPSDALTAGIDDALQDLDERIVQGPTESDRVEDGLQQLEEMIDSLQNDLSNENGTL